MGCARDDKAETQQRSKRDRFIGPCASPAVAIRVKLSGDRRAVNAAG